MPRIVPSNRRLQFDGPPFSTTAIGDPAVLRGALETRGGVVDRMQEAGLGVRIAVQRALVVPAARSAQSIAAHTVVIGMHAVVGPSHHHAAARPNASCAVDAAGANDGVCISRPISHRCCERHDCKGSE